MTVFGYFQYRHPQILSRLVQRWAKFDAEIIVSPPVLAARVIQLPELRPSAVPAGK